MSTRIKGSIIRSELRADGHMYYIVASGSGQYTPCDVVFLDYYDQLDRFKGMLGLFFVRIACPVMDKEGTVIHGGDPTVHEGWAMYTWDPNKDTDNGGWRKVAEAESVDGPWGIDETIRRQMVAKTDYTSDMQGTKERPGIVPRLKSAEDKLSDISAVVEATKHSHTNKTVLDGFTVNRSNQLCFKGTPISGAVFVYNNIDEEGHLIWKNPTDPESEGEIVDNSIDIAQRYFDAGLAVVGGSLVVVETDGSSTCFSMFKDNIVLRESYVKNQVSLTRVETLPSPDKRYVEHGYFVPTTEDGIYLPNRRYKCVENGSGTYTWVNASREFFKLLGIEGAKFVYQPIVQDDPGMPNQKITCEWKEPEVVTGPDEVIHRPYKTFLVRSIGRIPESIEDGTIVFTNTINVPGSFCKFEDTVVPTNDVSQIFYRLFTIDSYESTMVSDNAVNPGYLNWTMYKSLSDNQVIDRVFSVNDTFVLPDHPKYGVLQGTITLVASQSVTVKVREFEESVEEIQASGYTKFIKSYDSSPVEGKTYAEWDGVKFVIISEFREGSDVYELNEETPIGVIYSVEKQDDATLFVIQL